MGIESEVGADQAIPVVRPAWGIGVEVGGPTGQSLTTTGAGTAAPGNPGVCVSSEGFVSQVRNSLMHNGLTLA